MVSLLDDWFILKGYDKGYRQGKVYREGCRASMLSLGVPLSQHCPLSINPEALRTPCFGDVTYDPSLTPLPASSSLSGGKGTAFQVQVSNHGLVFPVTGPPNPESLRITSLEQRILLLLWKFQET